MRVQYTKWGERPHWRFAVEPIGRDRYGLWFGGRRGIPQQRADEPPITLAHDFVMLVPDHGCYTAFWNADDPVELYVDVTTQPVVNDGIIAAVDLDLDVIRLRTGTVEILDEDEFALHQVQLDYPGWLVDQARSTANWLVREISARNEPFDLAGPTRLAGFQRSPGTEPGSPSPRPLH